MPAEKTHPCSIRHAWLANDWQSQGKPPDLERQVGEQPTASARWLTEPDGMDVLGMLRVLGCLALEQGGVAEGIEVQGHRPSCCGSETNASCARSAWGGIEVGLAL